MRHKMGAYWGGVMGIEWKVRVGRNGARSCARNCCQLRGTKKSGTEN